MADWVEITQAAGPSAVALGALGFAGWQQTRTFRHTERLGDRAELRELLDTAARDLRKAAGYGSALQSQFLTHGAHITARAPGSVNRFQAAGRAVDLNHDRLSIRLGLDAPLVEAHQVAVDAANELLRAVQNADLGLKDSWEAIQGGNVALAETRERFVREAVALIGTRG